MSGRDRRALVVGGLIVGTAWMLLKGVPFVLAAVPALEGVVVQKADLLVRARARLADMPTLDDSIAALESRVVELSAALLVGDDVRTAAVDLMGRTRILMEQNDVVILEFGAPGELGSVRDLAQARLPVQVESDFEGLIRAARAIEEDPAMGLARLHVTSTDPEGAGPSERLTGTFEVTGWLRVTRAEPSPLSGGGDDGS